jgi:AraC-like DNA-binding protein
VGFSRRDCLTVEERKLKSIVIAFLLSVAFGWIVLFGYYFFREEIFVILSVPMLATFLFSVVLLYRIIRFLTRIGQPENFPTLHYIAPGLITAVFLGWMCFVPMDVQVEIVKSRQTTLPGDYATYARVFTSKPLLRLVFQFVYFIFIYLLLKGYYRKERSVDGEVRKPARWALFLTGLILITMFSSMVASFSPRDTLFSYQWAISASLAASCLYVLLTYHIIRRKYLLYVVYPVKRKIIITEGGYRKYFGQLTREQLEAYFHEKKPYLNANYKITDLMEAMDVNRNAASTFINQTYGVNFNRFINQWRIDELKRLLALPGNEKESAASLYRQAGFGELKQYYRASQFIIRNFNYEL